MGNCVSKRRDNYWREMLLSLKQERLTWIVSEDVPDLREVIVLTEVPNITIRTDGTPIVFILEEEITITEMTMLYTISLHERIMIVSPNRPPLDHSDSFLVIFNH